MTHLSLSVCSTEGSTKGFDWLAGFDMFREITKDHAPDGSALSSRVGPRLPKHKMGITFSYGPDLVEEIDWRKRVEFSLTHHGATLRVEPNKIDSLFVSALGLLFFSFALWNGAPLGVVVFPLVIVVGGICSYLTRVTYLLEPGVIERQVKFLGWTRKRTFTPGRLVLAVSHDDEEAPEVSVWRWEVKIESDGKGPVIIGNSVMGRHARINMDRARNCLVALAEASFWPTDVRMIYCRQPRRSAHR